MADIPMNNGGYGNGNSDIDIIRFFASTISESFQSLERTIWELKTDLKNQQSGMRDVSKGLTGFKDTLRRSVDRSDDTAEQIANIQKYLKQQMAQRSRVSGKQVSTAQDFIDRQIEGSLHKVETMIAKDLAAGAKAAQEQAQKQLNERFNATLGSIMSDLANMEYKFKRLPTTFEDLIKQLQESADAARESGDTVFADEIMHQLNIAAQSSKQAHVEAAEIATSYKGSKKLIEDANKAITDIEKRYQETERLIQQVQSLEDSKFFSGKKRTASEKLQEEINEHIDKLNKLSQELDEKIELATGEERELLEKQKELVIKELENAKKLTPLTVTWKKAGNDLLEAGKTIRNSISKTVLDQTMNRTIGVFQEGFRTVYDSIEKTRNEISTRLKLSSGEYKELEQSIFAKIDQAGLSGSVSSVEVNELISQAVTAGITDEDFLTELAIQNAKLKAAGSTLDLSSEEIMQQMLTSYKKSGLSMDDYFKQFSDMIDQIHGTEMTLDNVAALANGGFNQMFAELLKTNNAYNQGLDTLLKNTQSAMYSRTQLLSYGIDETAIETILRGIMEGKISDGSAFSKALYTSGVNEELIASDRTEAINRVYDLLQSTLGTETGTEYLKYISDEYGIDMTKYDMKSMQDMWKQGISLTDRASQETIDKNVEEFKKGLKDGTYMSATEQKKIAAQNNSIVENTALTAEQFYHGDQIVEAGFSMVSQGFQDVISALGHGIEGTLSSGLGGFGNLLKGEKGQTISDFLTGNTSTAAGKVGTVGGIAAGTVITAKGVFNAASAIDNGITSENISDVAANADIWSGVGTILGAAAAGPIGAAVGGVAGKLLGTALGPVSENVYEAVTRMDDPTWSLSESASQLGDVASEQLAAAQMQYDSANETINTLEQIQKQYSEDQKRLYLMNQGIENAYSLTSDEVEETLNLLKEEAEQRKKEAEAEAALATKKQAVANYLESDKYNLQNLQESLAFDMFDPNSFYKIGTNKGYIDEGTGQWVQGRYDYIVSHLGGSEKAGNFAMQAADAGGILALMDEAGITDEATRTALSEFYSTFEQNKADYDNANEQFQRNWETAHSAAGTDDPAAILGKYKELFDKEPTVDLSSLVAGSIPYLDTHNGLYDKKQQFKTGLTNVPYDGYQAILHKGERILTAEEAKAYNKFSSYAMSTLTDVAETINNGDVSSSVFNTTEYGMSDVKTAITNQTTSVEGLLNAILQAINYLASSIRAGGTGSSANMSILRGNSNLTQVNTI